jgi:FlgN protein.
MSARAVSRGDLRRLATLLRQERAALLRGDYARLGSLVPRKTHLLERLEGAEPLPGTPGTKRWRPRSGPPPRATPICSRRPSPASAKRGRCC